MIRGNPSGHVQNQSSTIICNHNSPPPQTPHLAVGIFHTTYTYYNTLVAASVPPVPAPPLPADGHQRPTATAPPPVVLTTRHTVTNTLTAPDDYLSVLLLQPSRPPLAHTAHTYVTRIVRTEMLPAGATRLVTDTHTQVVVTESLPAAVWATATPATTSTQMAAGAADAIVEQSQPLAEVREHLSGVFVVVGLSTGFGTGRVTKVDKLTNVYCRK